MMVDINIELGNAKNFDFTGGSARTFEGINAANEINGRVLSTIGRLKIEVVWTLRKWRTRHGWVPQNKQPYSVLAGTTTT